ncbi:MAG: hypothetical protein FJ091_05635 [Deltaproteobacteria bacterium]|nr:hypothetical protein [Deltaproteobacteria bacterium]
MLRASVEANRGEVDLRAISEGAKDDSVGVAQAAELTAFAEAALRGDAAALASARDALRAKAGSALVVDAAGVIGNFERMTRIADGTGIPLDPAPMLASSDFRAALGLDAYASAANTAPAPWWRRAMTPLLAPAAKRVMAGFMRR